MLASCRLIRRLIHWQTSKMLWSRPTALLSQYAAGMTRSMRFGTTSISRAVSKPETSSLHALVREIRSTYKLEHELIYIADGQVSNCPRHGIRYPPKRPQHEPTKTTTHGPEPTATGTPFAGKGYMVVSTMEHIRGCVISPGTWYASGTCATFRAEKASGSHDNDHPSIAYSNLWIS